MGNGGAVTCSVGDGAAVQVQAVGVNADAVGIVLARQDGVGEGQRSRSAAAGIRRLHRGAANIQIQVRRATRGHHRHGLAQGHHD